MRIDTMWDPPVAGEDEPTEDELAQARKEQHAHQQAFNAYRVVNAEGYFECAHCDLIQHEAFMHECEDCGFMVGNDCHQGECPEVGAVARMGQDDVDLTDENEVM